jgi:coenzyme F420-reducing hydrogenase delta subunit
MTPKAIIFCCNWSSYPGLQLSSVVGSPANHAYQVIVNMCSGRVSPEIILDAFKNHANGVLVAACPVEACEHDANYKTRRRIFLLRKVISQFGIDPKRIRLEWIDKGESGKLQNAIDNFMQELAQLGPIGSEA